jgi:hypothetical protein
MYSIEYLCTIFIMDGQFGLIIYAMYMCDVPQKLKYKYIQ